ncbi:Inosine-5'-monophosphate dehydrogenase [Caballeronia glathei]|uniref:Inosine-5-monophosphate dehydrogenase n=1 Tax=Caballeronia glathei TaxID=60547 RepID=A0A069PC47_9BURK|nr:CBS domain-containing protein [Caballeronia glathei]KDR38238.1 inosine-5-monophosphate dehydrogenase [Caballeronia glathei]CDY77817.1 Inosine-5'-monophosphate dehydrogenase [Caballeronia glathei]
MASVRQILSAKSDGTVHTIEESASVLSAITLMAHNHIGALVVTSGDQVKGIVTERDYARKIVLQDKSSKDTAVRDIMSKAVRYVRLAQTTDECMALMTECRIRHLPVIDGGLLVGMVSIGDLVKNLIGEQEYTIRQLEHYIQGGTMAPAPDGWPHRHAARPLPAPFA